MCVCVRVCVCVCVRVCVRESRPMAGGGGSKLVLPILSSILRLSTSFN